MLNVHETNCKDQLVSCLNFKAMPKQLSLSASSSKTSVDLATLQQMHQQQQQLNEQQHHDDANVASNGSFYLNKNNSYSSRPRSMDITKYFQVC